MTCKLSTLMTGKLSTLIVGDGNFSFACALVRLGKLPHPPCELTATSYDSKETLIEKYGDRAARNVEGLEMGGCRVMCGVDATNLSASFSPERTFDTIIFQHPLIDRNDRYVKAQAGEMSAKEDYIIANRLLILDFLLSAKQLLQEPDGEIKVTVKQVHPYTLWRVARLQEYAGGLVLKRVEAFKNKDYPGYETMNVEMNHAFPSETATTFIFGLPQSSCGVEQLDIGTISQVPRGKGRVCAHMAQHIPFHCWLCNKFFTSEADMQRHLISRKHGILATLEEKWTGMMKTRFNLQINTSAGPISLTKLHSTS